MGCGCLQQDGQGRDFKGLSLPDMEMLPKGVSRAAFFGSSEVQLPEIKEPSN